LGEKTYEVFEGLLGLLLYTLHLLDVLLDGSLFSCIVGLLGDLLGDLLRDLRGGSFFLDLKLGKRGLGLGSSGSVVGLATFDGFIFARHCGC
jgi:mevalonate kinase